MSWTKNIFKKVESWKGLAMKGELRKFHVSSTVWQKVAKNDTRKGLEADH